MTSVVIRLEPDLKLSDERFLAVCQANPNVKFEQNANGDLIIVAPTGGETGNDNFEISADVAIWNREVKQGVGFDSSTCFKLPNGAKRSPDVAWIIKKRWDALAPEDRKTFPRCRQILSWNWCLPAIISSMCKRKCASI